jgi:rod shape-determining protein MreC
LVLLSITFIVLDLRGTSQGPLQPLRTGAAAVFGPLESALSTVVRPIGALFGSLGQFGGQQDRIDDLTEENNTLRAELDVIADDIARVEALDALLGVAANIAVDVLPAQVIAVGPAQGFAWTVTVDVGTIDGIEPGMSVINGGGLVGRIISVGPDNATVLLVVDATSTVGGRLAGSSQIGIVSGTGRQDRLTMQLLDPLAPVEEGDIVVTFGSQGGRPFAPGIPVGVVSTVSGTPGQLTRVANLKPYANISTLSIVGVVVSQPRTQPRTVVPAPTPTPTPTPAPATSSETGE